MLQAEVGSAYLLCPRKSRHQLTLKARSSAFCTEQKDSFICMTASSVSFPGLSQLPINLKSFAIFHEASQAAQISQGTPRTKVKQRMFRGDWQIIRSLLQLPQTSAANSNKNTGFGPRSLKTIFQSSTS